MSGAGPERTHGAGPERTHGAGPERTHGAGPERTHSAGPERSQVGELLLRCLEQLSLHGDDVLDDVCAQHPEHEHDLRERMARLADLGLAGPARGPLQEVGPFRLMGLLGRGGMGEVHLAQQSAPVRRLAAVKLVHAGMDTERLLHRFDGERQALALLNHPAIAAVLQAGSTDDGRPWFAMEYVDGQPLTVFCDEQGLDLAARLELFLQVCDAVTHAHQKGILHRDLKPGNVLVTGAHGRAQAKVIDFGLAKALDASLHEGGLLTQAGQVVGTPAYMSPEQAGAVPGAVDTRTDQYALGVMLYELLTGALPLEPEGEGMEALLSMTRKLRDDEPVPPSEAAADAPTDGRPAARELRGDLDWICARALAKDPERRYASVPELAEDLRRHRRSEAVWAGPPSASYRMSRLLRRHKREAAVAAVALVALALAFVRIVQQRNTLQVQSDALSQELVRFDVLALAQRVDALLLRIDAEDWPDLPSSLPAMDAWVSDVAVLEADLGAVDEGLEDLRQRSEPLQLGQDRPPREAYLMARVPALLASVDRLLGPGGARDQVLSRRDWAAGLPALSVDERADDWARAAAAIAAHPAYAGLELVPQMGLIPLGPDPASGLWEFALPRPGARLPVRGADEALRVDGETCPVLVLIPGGVLHQGVRPGDPASAPWLPEPARAELNGHVVTLAPYFLGKHELSQGQYLRAMGHNPARYGVSDTRPDGRAHPVEQLDHGQAARALRRMGLTLPTGAQWEFAARGGHPSPWWTGGADLPPERVGNLADVTALADLGAAGGVPCHEFYDDGYAVHAPMGSFRPNPFGLHDVVGNVWEWCADAAHHYQRVTPRPGDGLAEPHPDQPPTDARELRGGSFLSMWDKARSTFRLFQPKDGVNSVFGVRAARPLDSDGPR